MKILLVTPPLTQLNTPYPATAVLAGFLKGARPEDQIVQYDLSLQLALEVFSASFLKTVFQLLRRGELVFQGSPEELQFYVHHEAQILQLVDPVIRFLQGKDSTFAYSIYAGVLPEGFHFQAENRESMSAEMQWGFGALGIHDQAKHLASLFLDDVCRLIQLAVDPHFSLSRYGEKLAASQPSMEPLLEALNQTNLVTEALDKITEALWRKENPDCAFLTAPFPGNLPGAFRIAKRMHGKVKGIALGGGYVNTELRALEDVRVFEFFDALCFDDGELPALRFIEWVAAGKQELGIPNLVRTLTRQHLTNSESWNSTLLSPKGLNPKGEGTQAGDVLKFDNLPGPDYSGLPLSDYLQVLEVLNPVHRLWSDGRWNKLTLAHGCYWKKCSFCDTSLDYISRYETRTAEKIVDQMQQVSRQTGQSGFHFTDEAAPPAMLKAISQEIIKRGWVCTWWGNVRFDKAFTPQLASLMRKAGCVAITGGLEVASDRLLKLMNKGVTVEQVARVTKGFSEAGILVHAYLMYGFPSQTVQETVDSLERVRQLFTAGCIHSAFWHRFSVTVHSPVGKDPRAFGIEILNDPQQVRGIEKTKRSPLFAQNDLPFLDPVEARATVSHEQLGTGLKRALHNYMRGVGYDLCVTQWFDQKVPKPKVPQTLIHDYFADYFAN